MHRREFTLQLYDANRDVVQPLNSVETDAPAPVWRCSGCLMAWGVYGDTTPECRPAGDGCPFCTGMRWAADNSRARAIDTQARIITASLTPFAVHLAAPSAIDATERAIKQGHYHRLTLSCQPHIAAKVRDDVQDAMRLWMRQDTRLIHLRHIGIDFHDGYMYGGGGNGYARVAAVNVHVRFGYNGRPSSHDERFTVRYRWVQ